MRLALMGQKLGHQVFIVIEQLSEIDVLLQVADEMERDADGRRAHQAARRGASGGGRRAAARSRSSASSRRSWCRRWTSCAALGRLDILRLIHFHLGSQITDIRFIKSGLQEIARFYVELRKMGVNITHVDVGGGLGVDYDGTNSTSDASVNYSLQEYANDVMYTLGEACREHEQPMPHLISESGRALTAHHALLLLKVIDVESVAEQPLPDAHRRRPPAAPRDGGRPPGRLAQERLAAAREGDLPRRHVRQGSCPRVLQFRRALAPRARAGRADLLLDHQRHRAALPAASRCLRRYHRRSRVQRSWTGTSATSHSSSRCPTAGPSTSSSRSCRSTGWMKSPRGEARSRT